MVPCQKTGTERPRSVPTRVTLSMASSRRIAETMPAAMPRTSANPTASPVSSSVTGSRSRMSCVTGLPVRHEVPRSPRASSATHREYWTYHGWSRPKNRLSSATMAALTIASAPIICSTTVPGISRSMRKISTVSPASVRAIEYARTTRYRPTALSGSIHPTPSPYPLPLGGGEGIMETLSFGGGEGIMETYSPSERERVGVSVAHRFGPGSGLVEPGPLEAIEERGRVLLEALHGDLREVDRIGREQPELRHVLEDQELDAVVDLLPLLRVHRPPALLEEGVELRHAPAVPVLTLGGVQRAEERRVGVGVARRGVHRQVEVLGQPALDPHRVLDVLDLGRDADLLELGGDDRRPRDHGREGGDHPQLHGEAARMARVGEELLRLVQVRLVVAHPLLLGELPLLHRRR